MSHFWREKRVLVTGGAGFIGSHMVEKLVSMNANVTVLDRVGIDKTGNLLKIAKEIRFIEGDCQNKHIAQKVCRRQEVVMNLAANVAGVDYNNAHKATMLSDNLLTQTVMIDAACKMGVERFLVVSSACVYPDNCLIPTPEEEGFVGEPETVNGGYGWAKRMGEILGRYYAEEFGIKVAIVRPYNAYGPRDHFKPAPFHVIPSLVKRVFDGEDPVVVWGSGRQTRAFLYVKDLVDGMLLATEKYGVCDPINLGTDEEITMRDLVKKIIKISGKNPKIVFDTEKPDGSPRRNSSNKKAKEKLGFLAKVKLEEGLRNTISWYKRYEKIE